MRRTQDKDAGATRESEPPPQDVTTTQQDKERCENSTAKVDRQQKCLAVATFVLAIATVIMAGFTAWSACQTKRMADQTGRMVELTQEALETNLLQARIQYLKGKLAIYREQYVPRLYNLLYKLESNIAFATSDNVCNALREDKRLFCKSYYIFKNDCGIAEQLCGEILTDLQTKNFPAATEKLTKLENKFAELDKKYSDALDAYPKSE